MEDTRCDYCGSPLKPFVINENALACMNCLQSFNTCRMCSESQTCAFETDPSPLPKVVVQTIRQGPAVLQMQVKNPERVKLFCFPCKCFDQDDLFCRREEGWCREYNEITPPLRDQRINSTFPETPNSSPST